VVSRIIWLLFTLLIPGCACGVDGDDRFLTAASPRFRMTRSWVFGLRTAVGGEYGYGRDSGGSGAKAPRIFDPDAALKRRSSTVVSTGFNVDGFDFAHPVAEGATRMGQPLKGTLREIENPTSGKGGQKWGNRTYFAFENSFWSWS
jgi:hypothetical protein